jgi:hypothetical protein
VAGRDEAFRPSDHFLDHIDQQSRPIDTAQGIRLWFLSPHCSRKWFIWCPPGSVSAGSMESSTIILHFLLTNAEHINPLKSLSIFKRVFGVNIVIC